jgi:cytochrome c oxidase subunit 2
VGTRWALFFGVVMLACAGLCVIAPFVGWWMPEGVSAHSANVDFLFNCILWITGFFFILTEAILVYLMARFGSGDSSPPVIPKGFAAVSKLLDSQHKIELAWTVVPAVILILIAVFQVTTWEDVKYLSHRETVFEDFARKENVPSLVPVQVEISARQFEWRMRYPSHDRMKSWLDMKDSDDAVKKDFESFAAHTQQGDVNVVNELHVFKKNPVVVQLMTRDVIHSFNLPQLRVKQDALPGKIIPVWFIPIKENVEDGAIMKTRVWDIPCAELCGWGHARMLGRLYVHSTKDEFLAWLKEAETYQYGVKTAAASK